MMDLEMPIITTQVPAGNQIGNTSALTYFADYYPLKMRGDGQSAPYDGGMTFKFKAYGDRKSVV